MGAVYEVVDRKTRRRRALKVMLPSIVADADLRARFKLEATITAEIESEHIVETLDADVDAETGAPFVVMDLLKGEDLGATLARRRTLPPGEVIELLGQAARALDRTHAAGVIHRDLKPENLFLTRGDDGRPKLKVLDFGIAKIVAESGAPIETTRAMGTPLYMPPEQIRGDGSIGPRADLYALAHVAYTLLAGEPYWKEDNAAAPALFAVFNRILSGPREPPSARAVRRGGVSLPPAFDGWFARATALRPEDRFATASAEVAALVEAFHEPARPWPAGENGTLPVEPPPVRQPPAQVATPILARDQTARTTAAISSEHAPPAPRRSAAPWLVGLACLLAGGAAAIVLLRQAAPNAGAVGAHAPSTAGATALDPAVSSASRTVPPAVQITSSAPISPPATASAPARVSPAPRPTPRPAPTAPRGGYDPTDTR
jgi:serine/threonine-protein kinase